MKRCSAASFLMLVAAFSAAANCAPSGVDDRPPSKGTADRRLPSPAIQSIFCAERAQGGKPTESDSDNDIQWMATMQLCMDKSSSSAEVSIVVENSSVLLSGTATDIPVEVSNATAETFSSSSTPSSTIDIAVVFNATLGTASNSSTSSPKSAVHTPVFNASTVTEPSDDTKHTCQQPSIKNIDENCDLICSFYKMLDYKKCILKVKIQVLLHSLRSESNERTDDEILN